MKKEGGENYKKFKIYDLRFMVSRVEKVNSLLQREIGQILLKEFQFGESLITLARVETTANLIQTRVYISVFPEEKNAEIIKTLNRRVYEIQSKINKLLNMRPIPKIIFVEEVQISEAAKIEAILEKLKKEEK